MRPLCMAMKMVLSFRSHMRFKRRKRMQRLIFIFILILLLSTSGWCEPIAIIVNKSNPIEDIRLERLAKLYNGEDRRWEDGGGIIVVNWPIESEIRKEFYKIVLKSEPSKMFFRLGTPIPVSYVIHKTSYNIKRFISHVDDSIGYIYLKDIDDTVKALRIDGIAPTNENISAGKYPLQTFNISSHIESEFLPCEQIIAKK